MAGESGQGPKVFSCPNCGAGVTLRARGQSLAVTCQACGSIIDPSNENYQIISKFQVNTRIQPLISLGTRGKLKGDLWEAIGFMTRSTEQGAYSWGEYLLFNPYKGFRWLVEYEGHWTFVTMTKERPEVSGAFVKFKDQTFKLFQSGDAVVDYVIGEFYWRVAVRETVQYADYLRPPQILSMEGSQNEQVWSQGEYIEAEEVSNAFNLAGKLPMQQGVGACQPFPHEESYQSMKTQGLVFFVLLILIHKATSHGELGDNLWVSWILALAPLFVLMVMRSSFEQKRRGDD